MSLLGLPNELLLSISRNLSPKELYYLIRSNCRPASLLIPTLHGLALEDKGGLTALQWAVKHGHKYLVRLLLQKGVNIDAPVKGPSGGTALHIAARIHSREAELKLLLENRANVEALDRNYNTPLYLAVAFENEPAIRLLLEHGADPMHQDPYTLGVAPFHKAVEVSGRSIVALMINKGADPNKGDINGNCILYTAIIAGNEPVVRLLLVDYVVDASPMYPFGWMPLHAAVAYSDRNPDRSIIKLLLEYGADPTKPEPSGRSALHYADTADIVALLVEGGADINYCDKEGMNALHWQARRLMGAIRDSSINELVIGACGYEPSGEVKNLFRTHLMNGASIRMVSADGKTVVDTVQEILFYGVRSILLEILTSFVLVG